MPALFLDVSVVYLDGEDYKLLTSSHNAVALPAAEQENAKYCTVLYYDMSITIEQVD